MSQVSRQYCKGTPAVIELNQELYQVFCRSGLGHELWVRFQDDNNPGAKECDALLDTYLNWLDFDVITHEINQQAVALVSSGMELLAKTIVHQLNLESTNYYRPILKSRRVVANCYTVKYWDKHGQFRKIIKLQRSLGFVGREAGVNFGQAIDDYLAAIDRMTYGDQKIPSRSVFGKGAHLEIHCFKDKHEFRFSQHAFDAILAFLSLHGHEECSADLTVALYATAEAA